MNNPNMVLTKKSLFRQTGFYIIIFGLILFITGGYFVYKTYSPNYIGIKTEAVVLKKDIKEAKKQFFYFDYRFTDVYGNAHEGRDSVSKKLYKSKKEGDTFNLYYLSNNQGVRYIPGSRSTMWPAVLLILGFAITFASGIGFPMYWRLNSEADMNKKLDESTNVKQKGKLNSPLTIA